MKTPTAPSQSFALDDADGDDFESVAVIQSLANHDPGRGRHLQDDPTSAHQLPSRRNHSCASAMSTPLGTHRRFSYPNPLSLVTVAGHRDGTSERYLAKLHYDSSFVGNTVQIGFSSAFVTQYRNPHSYMVDFADEDDLYNRVDDLLEALASWTSDGHETLETAYLDLIHKLVKRRYSRNNDLQLIKRG